MLLLMSLALAAGARGRRGVPGGAARHLVPRPSTTSAPSPPRPVLVSIPKIVGQSDSRRRRRRLQLGDRLGRGRVLLVVDGVVPGRPRQRAARLAPPAEVVRTPPCTCRFYRLNENPFNLTPDPRFLFLTAGHREALAQLVYGVEQGKGFIVLTGEVGTGKTTLLHALLPEARPQHRRRVRRTTPPCPSTACSSTCWRTSASSARGTTQAQRLFALNEFLIERRREGLKTVLIIDEAQNLSPETLEQVRLLSNFETPTAKLLQILLVGQPELTKKLQLPELRQLKQRIGLRCVIGPLTQDETREYIRTRLRIAGPGTSSSSRTTRFAGSSPRGRDPPGREPGLGPLSPHRLRGSEAPDRPGRGRGSHPLSRGRGAGACVSRAQPGLGPGSDCHAGRSARSASCSPPAGSRSRST